MAGVQLTAEALLARLVAFDTVSAKSNLALIAFAADYLDQHGAKVRLIHDETGAKANLFATFGPDAPGGIALSGHTDVVPVAGQDWRADPFTLTEREDRLYGRGAADMKGFIACALAAAPDFNAAARQPVHFALSYDEEVGCIGVRRMLDALQADLPMPALAVIGEPTGMRAVDSHKGIQVYKTTVRGRTGHSSRPGAGVNAVSIAARLIGFLDGLAHELRVKGGAGDPRFAPPHSTLNIGTIAGGTAVNMIAGECRVEWEIRNLPGGDPDLLLDQLRTFAETELLPGMRAIDPKADIATEALVHVPALAPQPDSPAVRLALALTGDDQPNTAPFACEAGLFQQAGVPAVICGPGAVDQAHQPDEFISRTDLARCTAFMEKLAHRAS